MSDPKNPSHYALPSAQLDKESAGLFRHPAQSQNTLFLSQFQAQIFYCFLFSTEPLLTIDWQKHLKIKTDPTTRQHKNCISGGQSA
jgi:hypothetical protein